MIQFAWTIPVRVRGSVRIDNCSDNSDNSVFTVVGGVNVLKFTKERANGV